MYFSNRSIPNSCRFALKPYSNLSGSYFSGKWKVSLTLFLERPSCYKTSVLTAENAHLFERYFVPRAKYWLPIAKSLVDNWKSHFIVSHKPSVDFQAIPVDLLYWQGKSSNLPFSKISRENSFITNHWLYI